MLSSPRSMGLSFCNFRDWLVQGPFGGSHILRHVLGHHGVADREFSTEGASMRVRKMVVATGLLALAAVGCGSAKSSGAQTGEAAAAPGKQGRTGAVDQRMR
ncbi:hypothetical protein [Actinocrispum sp. NPDC049592]|uniref:hypothetical protein n=1 Tax=Actinocrispum sp. NPDC049592 TaxID=3154835 RepID=UPI003420A541